MMKACWIASGIGFVAALVAVGCGFDVTSPVSTSGADKPLTLALVSMWCGDGRGSAAGWHEQGDNGHPWGEDGPFTMTLGQTTTQPGGGLRFRAEAESGEPPFVFEWDEVAGPPTVTSVWDGEGQYDPLYYSSVDPWAESGMRVEFSETGLYTVYVSVTDGAGTTVRTLLTFTIQDETVDDSDGGPSYDDNDPGYGSTEGETPTPDDSIVGSECFFEGECGEGYVCRDGHCEVYEAEYAEGDSGTTGVDTQNGEVVDE